MDLKRTVETFVHRIISQGEFEGLLEYTPELHALLKREIELVLIRGAIIQHGKSPVEYEAMLLRTFGPHWAEQSIPLLSVEEIQQCPASHEASEAARKPAPAETKPE